MGRCKLGLMKIKKCKYCKSDIDKNAIYCENCGKKQKTKSRIIFVIIACIIILILLGLFINALATPYCETGELIDGECLSCPEGYTLDKDSKECYFNSQENNQKPNNIKTQEEIIADYKTNCEIYSYKEVFRYAEDFEGKYAKFYGKVVQVSYNDDSTQILRVNVTDNGYGYNDDTIYVFYFPFADATRILEDDMVTVYGILDGLATYTSVVGSEITIPKILSTYIEIEDA